MTADLYATYLWIKDRLGLGTPPPLPKSNPLQEEIIELMDTIVLLYDTRGYINDSELDKLYELLWAYRRDKDASR